MEFRYYHYYLRLLAFVVAMHNQRILPSPPTYHPKLRPRVFTSPLTLLKSKMTDREAKPIPLQVIGNIISPMATCKWKVKSRRRVQRTIVTVFGIITIRMGS